MPAITARYRFEGNLVLITALHIGGGETSLGSTDSPVLRTASGAPFIPGSSLKGAFRATVEKLAATLGLAHADRDCIDASAPWLSSFYRDRERGRWSEQVTLDHAREQFPATAWLFGSTLFASKIMFADLHPLQDESVIERRDGVAIDRDSERAVDGMKYDFEVVPASQKFRCQIDLESPDETELQLACLGVSELANGHVRLGGKRSRGLGNCRLDDLNIRMVDLRDPESRTQNLRQYLTGDSLDKRMPPVKDALAFLNQHIEALLQQGGAR